MSNGKGGGAENPNLSGRPRRGGIGRRLLIGAGVLVVLLAVLIALAPTIVGWVGPGYIESAAGKSIKGSVKVGRLSLGWFSGTSVGPVELRDDKGRLAARLDISTQASTWSLVSTGLSGARHIDLGTVTLAGMVDAVREPGSGGAPGENNFKRAIEPRNPAPPAAPQPAPGSGLESLRAALKITNLDISVRDLKPDGTTSEPIGVKGLHGDASVDYGSGHVIAKADLSATPLGGVGTAATVPLTIKVDADVKPSATGGTGIDKADVKAELAGAPIALIDALANLGGALTSAVGPTAKLAIEASGNAQAATARLAIESDGANGDLALALKDGVLATAGDKPNRFTLRSTDFLASLPALRGNIAQARQSVRLTGPAPSLELAVDQLRIPLPPSFLAGLSGGTAAPLDPAALDFRAASLVAHATVSPIDGQIALDRGGPADAGARAQPTNQATPPATAPSDWQVFHVEQATFSIDAPDLSKPLSVKGGTKATLSGQSAGQLALSAQATGLLDNAGHLKALGKGGLADSVNGELKIAGVSTTLAQPLMTGLGLPLDLRQDVGPTLDLTASAKADTSGAQSPTDIPPTAVTVSLKGSNVQFQGSGRLDKGTLTSDGDGFSFNVISAAGLVNRIANPAGQPPAAQFSGAGRLTGTVRGLRADLARLRGDAPLSGLGADITASLNDLTVLPAAFDPKASPVEARSVTLGLRLAPGAAPTLDLKSDLAHQSKPFAAAANLVLNGLKDGKAPAGGGGGLDAAFKLGVNGSVSLTGLPHSLLAAVPALKPYLADPGSAQDLNAQIARAVQATIGKTSTLKLDFSPLAGKEAGTQARLAFETDGKAITAGLDTSVTASTLSVTRLVAVADVDPAKVNPVLAAAAQQETPGAQPMRIAQPFTLHIAADPITLPLTNKSGALQPDFAKASDAAISLDTSGPLVIDNVVIGTDDKGSPRLTRVTLADLKAQCKAPLAGLAAGAAPNSRALVKAGATLSAGGGDAKPGAPLAEFALDATAAMDGSNPQGTVKLANIDTKGLDALLAQGGLLSGALGDKADISAKAEPKGKTTLLTTDIIAPRFKGASIALVQDETQIVLSQPATITWTPDAAFLTRVLNGPPTTDKSAAPQPLEVSQATPFTIQLSKLAIAPSKTENGAAVSGPLKPGVFSLDAVMSTPSVGLSIAGLDKQPPVPAELQGIRVAARSSGGQAPGIDAELSIDKITGAGSAGQKKSTAKISLANLADQRGVLQTDKAVLNLDADFQTFPTPIADALARQGGLLTEALGPTVNLTAVAKNVSMKGGKAADGSQGAGPVRGMIDIKADSARANAAIKGRVRNGAFHQDGPVQVRVVEIRPELVRAMAGSVPIVETVEKTTKDAPATLDAESLQVPIDGDLRKLNGVAKIDPGIMRFTTKPIFGDLIGALGGKSAGVVGQKIEPFVVHFDKGVATYDRFTLPVGNFNLETKGTVDLVQRQIDVITYVPFFALTDKAAGILNKGIAGKLGVVDKNTLVPIRTRGSLDNPKTEIDPGLFLQETGDKLLKDPGKAIQKGLDDVIKGLGKPKPKK